MQRKQKLKLAIKTPDTSYNLQFSSVYETKDKLIAILHLTQEEGGGELVTETSDSVEVPQTNMRAKPVQYYVISPSEEPSTSWWLQSKKFTAFRDMNKIEPLVAGLQKIYEAEENRPAYRPEAM